MAAFQARTALIREVEEALASLEITPDAATRDVLSAMGAAAPSRRISLGGTLAPAVELSIIEDLTPFWPRLAELAEADPEALRETQTGIKYAGYLRRQRESVERFAQRVRAPAGGSGSRRRGRADPRGRGKLSWIRP